MEWYWIALMLAAIVGGLWYFWFRKPNKSPEKDPSVFVETVFLEPHYKGNTPKGARVYSYLKDVSMPVREAIDRGMQQTFNIASEVYGYKEMLTHAEYKVGVFPASNKCQGTGFTMKGFPIITLGPDGVPIGQGQGYEGGPLDLNPLPGQYEICVAGEFHPAYEGNTTASKWWPAISVVNDAAMAEIGARYETEHAVTLMNDTELYMATYDHSKGGGHPILKGGAETASFGFASRPFKCAVAKVR